MLGAFNSRNLTAVSDEDSLLGLVVSVDGVSLDEIEHGSAIADLAEDDVSTVEMWGLVEAEEELGSVGAWSSVGHGEDASASVLVDEVLVVELTTVDGLATSAVMGSEIATLGHEARDDSVEGASLEVETVALLSSAESAEVLGGLGGVASEGDGDSAS